MVPAQYQPMSQAIAVLRTGDLAAADAVNEPQSAHALRMEILKSIPRERLLPNRVHSAEAPNLQFEPVSAGHFPDGANIVVFLFRCAREGLFSCRAYDVGLGVYVEIPSEEMDDLVLQIHPDDPSRPFGFWSKSTGACRYLNPCFSKKEIAGAARASRRGPNIAAEQRLYVRLLEVAANGPVTKHRARELCGVDPDFWARGFERVWKKLPSERKYARGKHGPRAH